MAVNLPKIPKFVEYRPSMVGVPTKAVARMYDRLDRDALRTAEAATKMKTALAEQMAGAVEGDKAYLQGLYDSVDQAITAASKDNNLPGYSRQIKSMVSNMVSDPTFAAVRDTTKRAQAADKSYKSLVAQFGTANVMMDGDLAKNFSTIDPETNQPRQFNGMPTRIPDFGAAMDQVYRSNKDIVSSLDNLQDFVYNDGEQGALNYYINTPGGRTHMNMMAQQYTSQQSNGEDVRSFTRLNEQEMLAVQERMNKELFNAGQRFVKTASTSGLDKKLEGTAVLSSGQSSNVVTDGTDAADQVLITFDDQVDNTRIDNQLALMFEADRDIIAYDPASGYTQARKSTQQFNSKDMLGAKMTGALGLNGRPLVQLEMRTDEKNPSVGGFIVTELSVEDTAKLSSESSDFRAQLLQETTTRQTRAAAVPLFAGLYEPTFGEWAVNNNQEQDFDALSVGLKIRKEDGKFAIYQQSGKIARMPNGDAYRLGTYEEVQQVIGQRALLIN